MKKLVLAAAAIALVASPVLANTKHGHMTAEEKFNHLDTNKDGSISRAEFDAWNDKHMAKRKMGSHSPSAGGYSKQGAAPAEIDPSNTSVNDNIKDTKPN